MKRLRTSVCLFLALKTGVVRIVCLRYVNYCWQCGQAGTYKLPEHRQTATCAKKSGVMDGAVLGCPTL